MVSCWPVSCALRCGVAKDNENLHIVSTFILQTWSEVGGRPHLPGPGASQYLDHGKVRIFSIGSPGPGDVTVQVVLTWHGVLAGPYVVQIFSERQPSALQHATRSDISHEAYVGQVDHP